MRFALGLLALLLLASGCRDQGAAVFIDTARLAVVLPAFVEQYRDAGPTLRENQPRFSTSEWQIISRFDGRIRDAQAVLEGLPESRGGQVLTGAVVVTDLVANIRQSYRDAKIVIQAHWSELEPTSKIYLEHLDRQAQAIGRSLDGLEQLTEGSDATARVLEAVKLAILALDGLRELGRPVVLPAAAGE